MLFPFQCLSPLNVLIFLTIFSLSMSSQCLLLPMSSLPNVLHSQKCSSLNVLPHSICSPLNVLLLSNFQHFPHTLSMNLPSQTSTFPPHPLNNFPSQCFLPLKLQYLPLLVLFLFNVYFHLNVLLSQRFSLSMFCPLNVLPLSMFSPLTVYLSKYFPL